MAATASDIAWPPVVVVENASVGFDLESGKATGLDNREIRAAVEAMVPEVKYRRVIALYGPRGHLGVAFVVFPDSDVGYLEALALHNVFSDAGRGRAQWRRQQQQQQQQQEKKDLFGYLATPADMKRLDPKKNVVRRWSVESYEERVRRPQEERRRESEWAKRQRIELQQEGEKATQIVELSALENEELQNQLEENHTRFDAEKKRQQDQQDEYERKKAEQRRFFREERQKRLLVYHARDEKIKKELETCQARESEILKEVAQLEQQIHRDRHVEAELQKKHEELARYVEEHKHNSILEKKLAELKKIYSERLQQKKQEQRREKMAMKEKHGEKKQRMLQETVDKVEAVDQKISSAQENHCAICMEEFGSNQRDFRALFACGHRICCYECGVEQWERAKRCRCGKSQAKRPEKIPARFYL